MRPAREVCPRCLESLIVTPDERFCASCGLRPAPETRLWLASVDDAPAGFDHAAATRLEQLIKTNHHWMRERRRLIDMLLDRLARADQRRWGWALELGCGAGQMLPLLEARAENVVAIEGHRRLLQLAHEASARTTLMQGTVTDTKLVGSCFDLIVAFDVLEHVNADAFLTEARRLAHDGTKLLLSVPAFPSLWSEMDVQAGHLRRYRWKQLKSTLKQNNWDPQGYTHFQFLLFPFVYVSRRLGKGRLQKLERRPSPRLDCVLGAVNHLEVSMLHALRLPFGSSLFAWARAERL